ncbi:hypothetical protein HGB07_03430, partial [Candidatus Roizmanbacteria bacterium]|nr:hypothetical protein [Candidatus Roizmanbacteria bacterium]
MSERPSTLINSQSLEVNTNPGKVTISRREVLFPWLSKKGPPHEPETKQLTSTPLPRAIIEEPLQNPLSLDKTVASNTTLLKPIRENFTVVQDPSLKKNTEIKMSRKKFMKWLVGGTAFVTEETVAKGIPRKYGWMFLTNEKVRNKILQKLGEGKLFSKLKDLYSASEGAQLTLGEEVLVNEPDFEMMFDYKVRKVDGIDYLLFVGEPKNIKIFELENQQNNLNLLEKKVGKSVSLPMPQLDNMFLDKGRFSYYANVTTE